jgi:hypothetical protein
VESSKRSDVRVERPDERLHARYMLRTADVGFIDQDDIGEFDLVDEPERF